MGLFDKKTKKDSNNQKKTVPVVLEKTSAKISGASLALIKKPHISEKSIRLESDRQYVFMVDPHSNKSEVKKQIESMYKVNVEKVRVVNQSSKSRRMGGVFSRKNMPKKAFITVKSGQKINIYSN